MNRWTELRTWSLPVIESFGRDAEIWVMDLAVGIEVPLLTGVGNLRDGFLARQTEPSRSRS